MKLTGARPTRLQITDTRPEDEFSLATMGDSGVQGAVISMLSVYVRQQWGMGVAVTVRSTQRVMNGGFASHLVMVDIAFDALGTYWDDGVSMFQDLSIDPTASQSLHRSVLANLTRTLVADPRNVTASSFLEPFDMRSVWQMVGSAQQLPALNPVVSAVPSVSMLLSFPALDATNFTRAELTYSASVGAPMTELMLNTFVANDDPRFGTFEFEFRVLLQRVLARAANIEEQYVQFTNAGPLGETHRAQWWATGVQLGVSLAFPVETMGTASHPDVFAQRMLDGGVDMLFNDIALYGASCSSLLVQNGGQRSPKPQSSTVSEFILNVFIDERELSCPYDGTPVPSANVTFPPVEAVYGLDGWTCVSGEMRFELVITTGPTVLPVSRAAVIDIVANLTDAAPGAFNATTASTAGQGSRRALQQTVRNSVTTVSVVQALSNMTGSEMNAFAVMVYDAYYAGVLYDMVAAVTPDLVSVSMTEQPRARMAYTVWTTLDEYIELMVAQYGSTGKMANEVSEFFGGVQQAQVATVPDVRLKAQDHAMQSARRVLDFSQELLYDIIEASDEVGGSRPTFVKVNEALRASHDSPRSVTRQLTRS